MSTQRDRADLPVPMSEQACREWLRKQNPATMVDMQMGWKVVDDEINARARTARPVPKSFEVYHEKVVAQCAFITALTVANVEMAQNDARCAVGLPEKNA